MFQSTRDKIIDYLLDPTSVKQEEIQQMLISDPYARAIFNQEQRNIRIEAYLNNELSLPERSEFEKNLKNDAELAKEYNLRKKTNIAIQQENELLSILNEVHNSVEISETDKVLGSELKLPGVVTKRYSIQRYVLRWVAAACVAAIIATGSAVYLISNSTPVQERIYSQYYKPLSSVSSSFVVNSSSFDKARQKYAEGDYHNALQDFEKLPGTIDIQIEKQFFIGLTQMQLGNYEQAVANLNYVRNVRETNEFTPLTYWYLGLSYLKLDQKAKAAEMFSWLEKNSDYKNRQVSNILKKLK